MKKLFYLLFLVALVSCGDDEVIGPSGTVNVNLNAKYDGQDLVLGQAYQVPGANQIQFDQFSFFISNVVLLEAETEDETDLLEVQLADFSANTSPANVKPVSFEFKTVPAVKYRGIKFNVGVPSNLNKSSVYSYGVGHPLKQAFDEYFWSDGSSFFFMKLAGGYDASANGSFANSFELFPAKNANYASVTLYKDFTLNANGSIDLNLDVDVLKLLLDDNGQPIDLNDAANLSTYSPENSDLSALLMGNFQDAVDLK